MKILRITILFILLPFIVLAQDVFTGWEAHLSYTHIVDLILEDNLIYAASENAVFTYDIQTGEIQKITTIDGLEGGDITSFGYSENTNMLLIGYENGLLQLVELEEVEEVHLLILLRNIPFKLIKSRSIIYVWMENLPTSVPTME